MKCHRTIYTHPRHKYVNGHKIVKKIIKSSNLRGLCLKCSIKLESRWSLSYRVSWVMSRKKNK